MTADYYAARGGAALGAELVYRLITAELIALSRTPWPATPCSMPEPVPASRARPRAGLCRQR